MTKELGIMGHGFECYLGKVKWLIEVWTKQDISDEAFMLYQSMNEAWDYSCEFDHIGGN
jgi:hypothetical protein